MIFFDIKEVLSKANRLYTSMKIFDTFMRGEEIFPHVIKLKRVKQSDIQKNYNTILKEINEIEKSGLNFEFKEFDFKTIGKQKLPVEVRFDKINDFLKFIGKQSEYSLFVTNYEKIISRYPALKTLFIARANQIIQNLAVWDKLLQICDYFVKNPKPNIYIRELSIQGIDTKFIEKNKTILDMLLSNILKQSEFDHKITKFGNYGFERKYGLKYPLPLIRFRILDEDLYINGLSDITLNIEEFKKLNFTCNNIFIVENKITTLSFPKLKNSIVIFGSGYKVGVLKGIFWFANKNIYYWGDIDKDGFAILSQARGYFGQIKSFLMDEKVIELFSHLSVKDKKNQNKIKKLDNLTNSEQKIYKILQDGFRLEQEKIPFGYVLDILTNIRKNKSNTFKGSLAQ